MRSPAVASALILLCANSALVAQSADESSENQQSNSGIVYVASFNNDGQLIAPVSASEPEEAGVVFVESFAGEDAPPPFAGEPNRFAPEFLSTKAGTFQGIRSVTDVGLAPRNSATARARESYEDIPQAPSVEEILRLDQADAQANKFEFSQLSAPEPVLQRPAVTYYDTQWNRHACPHRPCGACQRRDFSVFADLLYFSVHEVNLPYATQISGVGGNAVPGGQTPIANPDRDPGIRTGVVYQLDDCGFEEISATYWNFQSDTKDAVSLPGGSGLFRADLVHPTTNNAAVDSLAAAVDYEIDFQRVDVDCQTVVYLDDKATIKGLIGLGYARLDQDMTAQYSILLRTTVNTDIDFDGVGPRVGFDLQEEIGGGWNVYSRGTASFLYGEFRADYAQDHLVVGRQASASLRDDRFVAVFDLELGLAWQSQSGRWGVSSGFHLGHWDNIVSTPDFISAVQRNDLDSLDDGMSFEGFIFRAFLNF